MECFVILFPKKRRQSLYINRKHAVTENIYTASPLRKAPIVDQSDFRNSKFYQARSTIIAYTTNELSYDNGDILEIEEFSANGNLHRAKHLHSNVVGMVSKNGFHPQSIYELQPWFFCNLTRTSSEELLLEDGLEYGTFLVRYSMTHDHNPFTLSIRSKNQNNEAVVKHYKICKGAYGYWISRALPFDSLEKLIAVYLNDVDGYLGLHHNIKKPCKKSNQYNAPLYL